MRTKAKLGEMLVDAGLITKEVLQKALTDPKRGQTKIGEYLVKNGYISEEDLINLLSKQLRIKRYQPNAYPVDSSLAKILPADLAQQYKVVPLKVRDNLVTIAMIDPMDIGAIDAVEVYTNKEADPVICTQQEFEQLLAHIYGLRKGLNEVMESIDEMQISTEDEEEVEEEQIQISALQNLAEEAPVIRLVNSILAQAVRERASDIHISPEKKYIQIRFRIDGKLQEVPSPPKKMFLAIVSRIKILANMDIATSRIPQDGRFTMNIEGKEINVRVSSLPTIYGENIVLRLLDTSSGIYTLEELGMSQVDQEKVKTIIEKPYGMILTSGPTGSGKSTTLYAILSRLNRPDTNIITLEDPVEYRIQNIRQVQLNPKAGMTFSSGLRSILRQDPDIVMVGEIRDFETANIAVQAALTGHRLLSSLHTNDAAGVITRFLDMGIEPFLVSSVLLASIAQRLVRKICPYCVETYEPDPKALQFLGLEKNDAQFRRGKGCFQCNNTGYRGRIGIYEVLINDELIQELTMRRASAREITQAAVKAGKLRTLKQDVQEKVLQGITTVEEAIQVVMS